MTLGFLSLSVVLRPLLSAIPYAGRPVRAQEDPWALDDFKGADHVHVST